MEHEVLNDLIAALHLLNRATEQITATTHLISADGHHQLGTWQLLQDIKQLVKKYPNLRT